MKDKFIYLIIGFLILIALQYTGGLIAQLMGLKFPSALMGMILFALLLHFKILPERLIEHACKLLLDKMVLFFVPIFVGIVLYFDLIAKNIIPILSSIVISTLITMIATAIIVDFIVERNQQSND